MNVHIPLELVSDEYGELDKMQTKLIKKYGALDLVLLENANELFRQYIMEGKEKRLEEILKKIETERDDALYLNSETINICENDGWHLDYSEETNTTIQNYIKIITEKIKTSNITKKSIIYTIFGLNLGEGGHYGAFVVDLQQQKIVIFDSMSGIYDDDDNGLISGTQNCFVDLAILIFQGEEFMQVLREKLSKDYNFTIKTVYPKFNLQPTGGFEELVSPELINMEDGKLKTKINIQHTDSQNHFCYIWSILFVHIYLRGKMKMFNDFVAKIKKTGLPSVLFVKKYILGLLDNLNISDLQQKLFFYHHFPRIWSNHNDKQTSTFELYEFDFEPTSSIKQCLTKTIHGKMSLNHLMKTCNMKTLEKMPL